MDPSIGLNNDSPKEQVLSVSDIKVAGILLDRWVTKMGLGRPEAMIWQC
jgi:hypothetical protein